MKRYTEIKVGIIMIVTIAIFIWLFHFFKGKNLLKNTDSYYIVYHKINSLGSGNPVLINGYKTGIVESITFLPDTSGDLLVKITMEKPFPIPKDSEAEIYSADLMGTQAIRIKLGHSNDVLQSGDTLAGTTEGSLSEQVSAQMLPVKVKAENLLASIDSVMAVIQYTFNEDFRDNFTSSFEEIRATIDNLQRSTYTVDTFLTNSDGTMATLMNRTDEITASLKSNLNKLDHILENVSNVSDSIAAQDLKTALWQFSETLEQTRILITGINEGKGTLGQLASNDSLYRAIESLTFRMDTLINRITEKPKKYLKISVF